MFFYLVKPKKYYNSIEPPRLTVGWFYEPDVILHQYGSHSEKYLNILLKVDKRIGRLVRGLKKINFFDDVMIGIISDHGNYTADTVLDLQTQFNRLNLRPLDFERKKGDYLANIDGVGLFYFKGGNPNVNGGIENESGFSALPGGFRTDRGNFEGLGSNAYFWTSDLSARMLRCDNSDFRSIELEVIEGISVRCVKD